MKLAEKILLLDTIEELKTKNLKKIGFTAYDIKVLLEKGVLTRVERGNYQYNKQEQHRDESNIESTNVIEKKENPDYNRLVREKKLYEINTNIVTAIKESNWTKVYGLLDELKQINTPLTTKYYKTYLYLLNAFLEKKETKESICSFSECKLVEGDISPESLDVSNKIISYIHDNLFKRALQNFPEKTNKSMDIIKLFLGRIDGKGIIPKTFFLIENRQWNEARILLEKEKSYRKLNRTEKIVKNLLDNLEHLESTGKIPSLKKVASNDVWTLIWNRDFETALKIRESEFSNNSKINMVIISLLKENISLIEKNKSRIIERRQEYEQIKNRTTSQISANGTMSKEKEKTMNFDLIDLNALDTSNLNTTTSSYVSKNRIEKIKLLKRRNELMKIVLNNKRLPKMNIELENNNYRK